MLGLKMHHSLPLILLSIEYGISAVPMVKRHITLIMPICGTYVVLNLLITVIRGRPVYDILDWKSLISFVIIIGAVVIGFAGFLLFHWINQKKLELYGRYNQKHLRMHSICSDKYFF